MAPSRSPKLSLVGDAPPLAARADDELMVLAAAGLVDAYEALVARHEARVRSYCRRMCRSAAIGDDAAQECFLRLWRMRGSYEPRGQFKALLFRIAENYCKNELRNRARRSEVAAFAEEPHASDASQLDALVATQRRMAVHRGLEKLPDAQRRAILLRFSAGLDYQEIASLVGKSEPTVRSRVFHGIARLRRLLGKGVTP